MSIQGDILEELAFKADRKGFFRQWQEKTSATSREKLIPIHDAAELVYEELGNTL